MNSYLYYETESREERLIPVNVLDLKIGLTTVSLTTMSRMSDYCESFKISFFNDSDVYQFLQFFEIEQDEITWKYIKNELVIYHKEMRFNFLGCFPQEFNTENQEVEIHYDYSSSHTLNDTDKSVLISQSRHKKLEYLGI